ncbi:protein-L-isoaspartate O-methyltransferase [Streptomyces hydrogenans]|uniref:protein-L-isoaspartate O-methyltransferase family protein n=1 Tax=Streptomyces hydrogenans TaxID=1873719 RepID=UPI003685B7C6
MTVVAEVADTVPERHYTHHDGRGETPHRSAPRVIHRELTSLDVRPGMKVIEHGTGSGYSGALLAQLVGGTGSVTSLDIDPYLVSWANLIHHQQADFHVRCYLADDPARAAHAPFHRTVAWCTPPLLPAEWVAQSTDDAVIVTPLPVAELPHMTAVVKIRVSGGEPMVEEVFHGEYVDATTSPKQDLNVPGRWVDWETRVPAPAWISIGWRDRDDRLRSGARATLERLQDPGAHTGTYAGGALPWASFQAFVAAQADPQLTVGAVRGGRWAIGHSTPTSAAVIEEDGTIFADAPGSASLAVLRRWLGAWEEAGRPAVESYSATLVPVFDGPEPGWRLRLA